MKSSQKRAHRIEEELERSLEREQQLKQELDELELLLEEVRPPKTH